MTHTPAFDVLASLYWLLLVLAIVGSLVLAALAFKLKKQVFAIASAGGLAFALLVAAAPAPAGPASYGSLLGVLALALAVIGGAPIATLALTLSTRNSVAPGAHGGILVDRAAGMVAADAAAFASPGTAMHEVLRGGLAIGLLERFAVAGAILAGFPEAIAVVVAIKGVGRFTELAAAEARERFIIGTLASLIWACTCAALVPLAVV
ncbi:hypothetical protein [Glaciibacter psychrotolerans]|uniref:Uncharacterized protein n=1 Tax=Glaciibacter psychrotolerans TaxID=670054 RepID=A0A7Z0EB83_9MICO|nr:hypothetical protein [Leifsonia psychrotolerans]NYJ18446.1 hypothetical protein [Leifsonia psychrotolerans]